MISAKENDKILDELNDKKILEYSPAIAFSALVIILGISGNIFSIAYYGFKSKRTTTNILIAVLATTDLIACIVYCDEIIELCFTITFKNVPGCKVMYFTNHTLVVCSSFILVLISVERFQKICKRHTSWQLNVTSMKICTGALLLLAVLLSVRDFVILDVVEVDLTVPGRNDTITGFYCTHTRETEKRVVVTAFQLLDLFTLIVIILTLTVLYTFVGREIWIQRKKKESHIHQTSKNACASVIVSAEVEGSSSVSAEVTASSSLSAEVETSSNVSAEEMSKAGHHIKRCKTVFRNIMVKSFKDHDEQHLKRKHSEAVEKKIAIMMIVITAISILSFVPYFIVNLAVKRNSNTPEQEFSVGIQIALRSYMMNNAVNPYIMCLFNTKFRNFVKYSVCNCRQVRE